MKGGVDAQSVQTAQNLIGGNLNFIHLKYKIINNEQLQSQLP